MSVWQIFNKLKILDIADLTGCLLVKKPFFNSSIKILKTPRYFQLKVFIIVNKKKVILLGYLIKDIAELLKFLWQSKRYSYP